MDIYKLYRNFWDWAFENPEEISPNIIALYSFSIEHCNRMGWKQKFGLPSQMAMEAIGVKSYNTYIKAFNFLVDKGFFKLVQKSQNQYSSNIIALSNFDKALDKALDKAMIKHTTKQSESTGESNDSIDKQIYNSTNLPITDIQEATPSPVFSFKNSLLEYGFKPQLVNDWLQVRKLKKAANTETAYESFIKTIEKLILTGREKNEILAIMVERSWSGLKVDWIENYEKINTGIVKPITPATNYNQIGATFSNAK